VARYPLNQPVRVSTTVRDLNGALADPSSITLTLAKPDGTQQVYSSPAHDSTGLYHQDLPAADLATAGHYQYVWTTTGSAPGVAPGTFDVYDPFEVTVLSLEDAKITLNIPASTTTYDSEIASWVASIQSSLERFTGGPIVNRAITERVEIIHGYTAICLRQRPVVSVTSITPDSGSALSLADIKVDTNAGVIRRANGLPFYVFGYGPPWANAVYVAGWGSQVPAAFNDFARIVIDHLWSTQRGSVTMPMGGEETVLPGFAYAIPNRAAELLNGAVGGVPFTVEAYL